MLSRYGADAVIAKANENIRNFKQGSLTAWDLSRKLLDRTLRCGGVYNKQKLCGFIVEGIKLIIHSNMRLWSGDNRETTLEDPANQGQCFLDLQGGNRRTAKKDGQWTEVVRGATRDPRGRGKKHIVTAVRDSGTKSSSDKNELTSSRS